jgi:hypothetical protein
MEWLVAGFVGYEPPARGHFRQQSGWVANEDAPEFKPEFLAEIERIKAQGFVPVPGRVVGGF